MSSSRTPLFVDRHHRNSFDSTGSYVPDDEETSLLGGIATTSPSRPFSTTFHPTIILRSFALLLSLPAFILLLTYHPHKGSVTSSIVFLSFAIARQVQIVLLSHFGSQIVVIRIEVVHIRLKNATKAAEQEKWIKKGVNAFIDGVILLGLLVSLALAAHKVKNCWSGRGPYRGHGCGVLEAAVILGFLSFGLLLLSVADFGSPALVTTAISVERPVAGVWKLATSVAYGEPEEGESGTQESQGKSSRSHASDDVV